MMVSSLHFEDTILIKSMSTGISYMTHSTTSCSCYSTHAYFILLHVREMVWFPFLSPSPVNSVTTTWHSRSHTVICSTNIPITTTATKCVTACRITHKMYKAVGPSFVPWCLVDTFFHIEMVILFSLPATMRWTLLASWVFICASVVANGKMACLTVCYNHVQLWVLSGHSGHIAALQLNSGRTHFSQPPFRTY